MNLTRISREVGVAAHTVRNDFELLVDTRIATRVRRGPDRPGCSKGQDSYRMDDELREPLYLILSWRLTASRLPGRDCQESGRGLQW